MKATPFISLITVKFFNDKKSRYYFGGIIGVKVLFAGFFILLVMLLIASVPKKYFYQDGWQRLFSLERDENILILGKPGFGYYGGENTDSMIVMNIKNDRVFLIYIPRDLIIKNGQHLYKINSLSALNKRDVLLEEVEKITNLRMDNFIEYDLYFVRKLVDAVGGIDVEIKKPVIDAVSGYTLLPGQRHLNGEWVEFVLRSRYAYEGDFFRMKNQFEIIKALERKIKILPTEDMLKLTKVLEANKKHYQTNLSPLEILNILAKIEKTDLNKITEIIPGFGTNLWQDGQFQIGLDGYSGLAYGLIPREGVGRYFMINKYINNEIAEAIAKGSKKIHQEAQGGIKKEFGFGQRNQ
jgi:LCP family protein required for cell wall assembly